MIVPATISEERSYNNPKVDDWIPNEDDMLFTHCKGAFVAPIFDFYGLDDEDKRSIDYFILTSKRCYATQEMKEHMCHYLNYFEKFYDQDKELFMIYSKIKYLIDYEASYTKDNFLADIQRYILSPTILWKVKNMNDDNYIIDLVYKNNNSAICYTNRHAKLLMRISMLMNMIIPLACHFMYMRSSEDDNNFILTICDILLNIELYSDVDLYNKLYETAITNVNTSYKRDTGLWDQQDIRSKNVTTHALSCIDNILLNVLPKYVYNKNIVSLNFGSINNNNGFQITGITWEYSFIPLSLSNRDEDNNSEFDKYESLLIRNDESLLLQNDVNCSYTMKQIEMLYGPFEQDEINFYYKEFGGKINKFQKELVFNLFMKYFGDPMSIKSLDNIEEYIKLVIAAKRLLEGHNLRILPYIISGNVVKLIRKKNINKKEYTELSNSIYFKYVIEKYVGLSNVFSMNDIVGVDSNMYYDPNIEKEMKMRYSQSRKEHDRFVEDILSFIATLSVSTFKIVDYDDPELNGTIVENIPSIIMEEVLIYLLLI
jgi:hypothetical protein